MNDDNWSNLHIKYSEKDWSKQPSIFAEQALDYFPKQGTLLELGTGVGQDSIYYAEKGYQVTATDLFVDTIKKTIEEKQIPNIMTQAVDLRKALPFEDSSFDIIYAHLSLHYFDLETTQQIFDEVYRVLKSKGVFAFFTNSTSDPEYGTGAQIESDYFLIDNVAKRYFSVDTVKPLLQRSTITLLDNKGETYKDRKVGVRNLIRAITTKP